ncbi:MAG: UDP-N-acetylglucosamine 2-epimerase (non-hydrolyzing) [Candidatus Thiodiazotropha sp. (ex Monitilora ramsayi)]|nr:UDP-N-acetylglucosamine 2-epimerase (non-hydrolyzing) [Candidatus Thiodiazotropha sp. (ex Monitilora ramsayi)]
MKRTIHLIAAARPNFMKIAPLYHALMKESELEPVIVHTGQHYDLNMSDAFFQDLRLPEPHIHLGAGSGSHAEQTGRVMIAYEKVVMEKRPDMVVVVGDVNSTIACTLAATKVVFDHDQNDAATGLNRPMIAHLEAGLRSFDRTMPEEVNRLATDVLADLLWTPSPDGDENLQHEGVAKEKIVRVGNIMIDSLEMMREAIEAVPVYEKYGVTQGDYAVLTLHRPANVDNPTSLKALCDMIVRLSKQMPIIFPVHPRTRKNLENTGLIDTLEGKPEIRLLEPQNYISFMNLIFNCRLAVTDSGGLQEETSYLGIPCLTLRPNTERPITITQGTNQLCTLDDIDSKIDQVIAGETGKGKSPDLWDGHTADRVVTSIRSVFNI